MLYSPEPKVPGFVNLIFDKGTFIPPQLARNDFILCGSVLQRCYADPLGTREIIHQ